MKPPEIAYEFEANAPAYWKCNPYSVVFSPDGALLAIGIGGYYGAGSIALHSLDDGTSAIHVAEPVKHRRFGPTISGLCFDAAGEYLAASGWRGRHSAAPTRVYRVDGLTLSLLDSLESQPPKPLSGKICPTGVIIHEGQVLVRNATTLLTRVVDCFPDVVRGSCAQPFGAHRRMAIVGDLLLTGGGGSLRMEGVRRGKRYRLYEACAGLAAYELSTGVVREVPVAGIDRVTAIVATPSGDGLIIGGLDGELQRWTGEPDAWTVAEIAGSAKSEKAGAFYRRRSIVGLCFATPQRWFSVTAGGDVSEWRGATCHRRWSLETAGAPRSIAVQPERALLAVAVKGGYTDEAHIERGSVVVYAV